MFLIVLDTLEHQIHVKRFRPGDCQLWQASREPQDEQEEGIMFAHDFYPSLHTKRVTRASMGLPDLSELVRTGQAFMVSYAEYGKDLDKDMVTLCETVVQNYEGMKQSAIASYNAVIAAVRKTKPGVIDVKA